MKLKHIIIASAVLLAGTGMALRMWFFKPVVPAQLNEEYLYIPTGTDQAGLTKILLEEGFINNEADYERWKQWEKFDTPRAGRYKIKAGWDGKNLVRHLKIGKQAPLNVTLNSAWLPRDIAGKAGKYFECDSMAIIALLSDSTYLDSIGYKPENLMTLFIPNTYEMFWNSTPRDFVERMLKEHKRFWNEERVALAKQQNLTPEQAYSMASIVERESNKADERPKVAGVYLNRLNTGMKLQADPTVQYALMQTDGGPMRRLYNSDYLFSHPYNTYLHEGLPPGPISMASIESIEAVLKPEKHNYTYFCARPDNSGYHAFAETYQQHLVNVDLYSKYLNSLSRL